MADERAVDRIVDLETTTSPLATDYVPVDSTNQGTRRLSFPNLADKALDELNTKDFNISTVGNRTIPNHIRVLNDRIGNIIAPSGQPSLSELVDIRTNFLGETFASAGDAVRVTDELASELENTSIVVTEDLCLRSSETDQNHYNTYSAKISRYVDGRIVLMYNTSGRHSSLNGAINSLSDYGRVSNTAKPDTQNGVSLPQTLIDFWKAHGSYEILYTVDASGIYREMVILPIPEDVGYNYFWLSVINENFATYYAVALAEPLFSAYGRKGGHLTFSDPSQDGNIVIS